MDGRTERGDLVYVPRTPGPLVSAPVPARRSDEIDDVLDDVFGADDTSGPSRTDLLLVTVGVGAIGVGQFLDLSPAVTAIGIGLVCLGAILPIRSAARHLGQRQQRSRAAATIGDGIAIRQDHSTLSEITQLHDRILQSSERLVPEIQGRFASAAHALVEEVATLLDGRLPVGAAEVDYVNARAASLAELAATADDPRIGDGDLVQRESMAEARIEVEQAAGGSALTDAEDLRNELLPDSDV